MSIKGMIKFLSPIAAFLCLSGAYANPKNLTELDAQISAMTQSLAIGISGVKSTSKLGAIAWITPDVCAGQENCYGANPNSPYGVIYLPLANGEPTPPPVSAISSISIPGQSNTWQLREDEAVVVLGWTPSSVKYFGFTPYLMGRSYQSSEEHKVIFGAFGDTLNELVIGTGGSPTRGVNSFGQFTAIILTADKTADSRIRSALGAQGIASTAINTIAIPKKLPLYLGWSTSSDFLGMLIRMGIPLDATTTSNYIAQTPLRFLRVTPNSESSVSLFATPALRPQGTGTCEGKTNLTNCKQTVDSQLETTFNNVVSEIKKRFSSQGHPLTTLNPMVTPASVTENGTAGEMCAKLQQNCNADNRDTIYSFDVSDLVLSQNANDFVFYVGVNHVNYSKATYFNHSVYRQKNFAGVVGFSDKDTLVNGKSSIEYFLGRPAKNKTELNLYAYKVSRDCKGEPFCLEVPTSGSIGVPVDESLRLMGRIYLEPSTKVKPSEKEVLPDQFFRAVP